MLLPQDVSPEKSLYVIGGQIIQAFNIYKRRIIEPKVLYDNYISLYNIDAISYSYFLYALDWLYIMGFIEVYNDTKIKRCF